MQGTYNIKLFLHVSKMFVHGDILIILMCFNINFQNIKIQYMSSLPYKDGLTLTHFDSFSPRQLCTKETNLFVCGTTLV